MKCTVEVRQAGNELLPLLVLGLTSMALVAGMAYAVQEPDTATSITRTAEVVFAVLGAGCVGLAAVILGRGRPWDAEASADATGLLLVAGGRRRRIGRAAMRTVYAIADGDRWAVEIERHTGATRLLVADRESAERLAGALLGKEQVPAALYRLRKKAHYYLFVTVCSLWVLVYAGLVALPVAPLFAVIVVALLLPPAVWATLRAVPLQLVVAPWGLVFVDPFRVRHVPAAEVADGRVVDDDTVRIDFAGGDSLRLDELADHPRDRSARTSAPPAERLEASLQELLRLRAEAA